MPSLQIVVPYVGRADYLQAAVRSVLSQSDPAWHLTVVEDGPQHQGAAEWVEGLGDERVRHVQNPRTLGVADNFQRCLDLAKATWVVLVGCDDLLLPDYVATMRRTAAAFPTASAIIPGVETIDADGNRSRGLVDRVKAAIAPNARGPVSHRGDRLLASLMHGNWSYFPSIAWRREVISEIGFRSDLATTLDLALLSSVILDGGSVVTVPDPVFCYRRHALSASSLRARDVERFTEEARLFREIADVCVGRRWDRSARAARWHLTSKLHALSLALQPDAGTARRPLLDHALGR